MTCSLDNCDKPRYVRNWCSMHYSRWYKTGTLEIRTYPEFCSIEDCGSPRSARGWCVFHYNSWHRHGDPLVSSSSKRGRGAIDEAGYRLVKRPGHPNARENGYIPEHRLVMSEILGRPLMPGENVHHINGDKLDNRPGNLELWRIQQPPGQRVSDLTDEAAKWAGVA